MFNLRSVLTTRYILPVLVLLFVSGCSSSDFADLENQVAEILASPGGRVEPLPEIEPYEAYTYVGGVLSKRDPFEPFFVKEPEVSEEGEQDTGLSEEMQREIENRNREELERFELDSLEMVGTVEYENAFWAIILDPDRSVHRVKVGNYIGKNIGRIISILGDRVELREIFRNSQGRWEERGAALSITETE